MASLPYCAKFKATGRANGGQGKQGRPFYRGAAD
jgi:hypothetical protein